MERWRGWVEPFPKIIVLAALLNRLIDGQHAIKEDVRVLARDLNAVTREIAELRGRDQDIESRVVDQWELRFLRARGKLAKTRELSEK